MYSTHSEHHLKHTNTREGYRLQRVRVRGGLPYLYLPRIASIYDLSPKLQQYRMELITAACDMAKCQFQVQTSEIHLYYNVGVGCTMEHTVKKLATFKYIVHMYYLQYMSLL